MYWGSIILYWNSMTFIFKLLVFHCWLMYKGRELLKGLKKTLTIDYEHNLNYLMLNDDE